MHSVVFIQSVLHYILLYSKIWLVFCCLTSPLLLLMEVQCTTKGPVVLLCSDGDGPFCFIIECHVLMLTQSIKWASH